MRKLICPFHGLVEAIDCGNDVYSCSRALDQTCSTIRKEKELEPEQKETE